MIMVLLPEGVLLPRNQVWTPGTALIASVLVDDWLSGVGRGRGGKEKQNDEAGPGGAPEVQVMYVESATGVAGASGAFDRLEARLPSMKGRKFYGTF